MAESHAIKSAFNSPADQFSGKGIRPVIFDLISPDGLTSLLPDNLKLVLHVNPTSISISYTRQSESIQTLGGFIEQHWGNQPTSIDIQGSTGGFMRAYTGVTSVTGLGPSNERLPDSIKGIDLGGSRRDTIAYDKFLDLLALFHNNGAIYAKNGQIAFQGYVKLSFDGSDYYGWFENFSVTESADKPYSLEYSTSFQVFREEHRRTLNVGGQGR